MRRICPECNHALKTNGKKPHNSGQTTIYYKCSSKSCSYTDHINVKGSGKNLLIYDWDYTLQRYCTRIYEEYVSMKYPDLDIRSCIESLRAENLQTGLLSATDYIRYLLELGSKANDKLREETWIESNGGLYGLWYRLESSLKPDTNSTDVRDLHDAMFELRKGFLTYQDYEKNNKNLYLKWLELSRIFYKSEVTEIESKVLQKLMRDLKINLLLSDASAIDKAWLKKAKDALDVSNKSARSKLLGDPSTRSAWVTLNNYLAKNYCQLLLNEDTMNAWLILTKQFKIEVNELPHELRELINLDQDPKFNFRDELDHDIDKSIQKSLTPEECLYIVKTLFLQSLNRFQNTQANPYDWVYDIIMVDNYTPTIRDIFDSEFIKPDQVEAAKVLKNKTKRNSSPVQNRPIGRKKLKPNPIS